MDTINIAISYVHEKGYGFGVVPNTGEQCFIPPHVLDGAGVSRGDIVSAHVVTNPNEEQRQNTRWCALNLVTGDNVSAITPLPEPAEPTPEPMSAPDLDAAVLAELTLSAYLSTGEIAQAMGVDTTTANNSATRLFNSGQISKAEVYSRPDQSRASFLLWAEVASDFLDVEDR